MNKNKIVVVAIILMLLFFLAFFARNEDGQIMTEEEHNSQTKDTVTHNDSGDEGGGGGGLVSVSEEADDVGDKEEIISNLSPKLQKMARLADASVYPIEFWGEVVDQYGEPVSEVNVLYYAGGGYLGGGSGFGRIKTDSKGRFHISGREGGSLDIREMSKEGCQIALSQQGTLFYSYNKYPDSLIWTNYNEIKPYRYQVWKISDSFTAKEQLVPGKCRVYLKSDGTEYSINFWELKKKKYSQDIAKGQLKVQFFREAGSAKEKNTPWKLVLTPLDGGILAAETLYTNIAPKDGYQDSAVLTQDDYKVFQFDEIKSYYFTMEGGKTFARISLRLNPYFRDDKGAIKARYTINSKGERYLDSFDGWVQ